MKSNSFPASFEARLKAVVPPGLMSQVMRGYAERRPTTFRVNPIKGDPQQTVSRLEKEGIAVSPHRDIPLAYVVTKGSDKKLRESSAYQNGQIYLQSFSSQIPPHILSPKPGEKVWDMAAAPGGKTSHLAAMMTNRGELVATEPDRIRFDKLTSTVTKQGATMVKLIQEKAEKGEAMGLGPYDKILLDAPCSSEGTFSSHDPGTFRHWSLEFVEKISILQKMLIETAAAALKPGGRLLYSTCSLSPEENEEVVSHALSSGGLELLPLQQKWPFLTPAFASWKGMAFPAEMRQARRVYPSQSMEGFFVALMGKKT